jgi:hypothetical protein
VFYSILPWNFKWWRRESNFLCSEKAAREDINMKDRQTKRVMSTPGS